MLGFLESQEEGGDGNIFRSLTRNVGTRREAGIEEADKVGLGEAFELGSRHEAGDGCLAVGGDVKAPRTFDGATCTKVS